MTPMRALITGCAGFIGSHLTEAFLADGHEVLGVDCFNDNYARDAKLRNLEIARSWDGFEFVPIDLARGALQDLVEEADVICHLAAEPGVRPSWGQRFESYVRNNVLATQHLLEAVCLNPNKRVVYASSSSIYGQSETFPTNEQTIPAPRSPYGLTKLDGEYLCFIYRQNFGVETVALRYFSVYGPRQRPDMAFSRFCIAALSDQPIDIYGDGEQTRDFTFVADVVSATRAAAEVPGLDGAVMNIGGGSRISLAGAVDALSEISGRNIERRLLDPQKGDIRDTAAAIDEARSRIGYMPRTSIEEGLAAQWSWAQSTLVARPPSARAVS
jgi:UDP-glucuronate 4-epimerase